MTGCDGTRAVVDAGGAALAQDEATSVVWGMPGAIAQAGLCHAVLPLPRIAPARAGAAANGGARMSHAAGHSRRSPRCCATAPAW